MPRCRSSRSQATQQALIDAARATFSERGVQSASLDDIAGRANVTKATLYYHFESKDDLYLAVQDAYLDELEQRIERLREQAHGPTEAFVGAVDLAIDEAMDPSKRYLHTRELSTMGAAGVSRARSRRLSFQHHFELVVRSAQAEGKVIPGDPGILVRMMTTTVLSGVWYNPDGPMSPDDFRALLRRIVLRGLLFTEPRPASTS